MSRHKHATHLHHVAPLATEENLSQDRLCPWGLAKQPPHHTLADTLPPSSELALIQKAASLPVRQTRGLCHCIPDLPKVVRYRLQALPLHKHSIFVWASERGAPPLCRK